MTINEFLEAGYTLEQNVYRKDIYAVDIEPLRLDKPFEDLTADDITTKDLDGELIDEVAVKRSDYTIKNSNNDIVIENQPFEKIQSVINNL